MEQADQTVTTTRGRVLPAAVAVAFIAAVSGSLWLGSREDEIPAPVAVETLEALPAAEAAPPVAEVLPAPLLKASARFAEFAREEPPEALPLDHGYTAEALRRIAAVIAHSGDNALWPDRARRLEAAAARLEQDAASLDHADIAREAFVDAADWLDAKEARKAAEALDAEAPLRSQKDEVARVLQALARSLPGPAGGAEGPGSIRKD